MTSFYLDTSAVIRWILQSPNHYTEFGKWDSAISSTLLKLEFTRAIDRLQKQNFLDDKQFDKCIRYFADFFFFFNWVKIDERILEKASQTFIYPLGTLDAIHLATAYLYQEEFEVGEYCILTHDLELAKVATSIGIKVKG